MPVTSQLELSAQSVKDAHAALPLGTHVPAAQSSHGAQGPPPSQPSSAPAPAVQVC